MKTKDFFFNLPEELVAQHPSPGRGGSRLLVLDRPGGRTHSAADDGYSAAGDGASHASLPPLLHHSAVRDLAAWLEPGSLLVFNDSRVRKSRIYGTRLRDMENADSRPADPSANALAREFLLVRRVDARFWQCLTKKAKSLKDGEPVMFAEGRAARFERGAVTAPDAEVPCFLRFDEDLDESWLERRGHIPLPPYIRREDADEDAERYQTIYARDTGSSAAPTAGLHFTEDIFASLDARGIERAFVTLHVGLGTFMPVRVENIEEHVMHREDFSVGEECADAVERAKAEGRPVVAVGTTSLRCLESAWDREAGKLRRGPASTAIFITPGYRFGVVDKLFTNFHTPESTLLMLVSAFAGRDTIMAAYEEAIRGKYRFFSYGDAMLIR